MLQNPSSTSASCRVASPLLYRSAAVLAPVGYPPRSPARRGMAHTPLSRNSGPIKGAADVGASWKSQLHQQGYRHKKGKQGGDHCAVTQQKPLLSGGGNRLRAQKQQGGKQRMAPMGSSLFISSPLEAYAGDGQVRPKKTAGSKWAPVKHICAQHTARRCRRSPLRGAYKFGIS